jgi:hypothetical protein
MQKTLDCREDGILGRFIFGGAALDGRTYCGESNFTRKQKTPARIFARPCV